MSRQRDDLEKLRAELFKALGKAAPSVKAQIAGQLRAVVKDLAALGGEPEEVSKADELKARREARRSTPADSARTTRRGQSRRRGGSNRTG